MSNVAEQQVLQRDVDEWTTNLIYGKHMLASAKENTGVDEVFAQLAREAAIFFNKKVQDLGINPLRDTLSGSMIAYALPLCHSRKQQSKLIMLLLVTTYADLSRRRKKAVPVNLRDEQRRVRRGLHFSSCYYYYYFTEAVQESKHG